MATLIHENKRSMKKIEKETIFYSISDYNIQLYILKNNRGSIWVKLNIEHRAGSHASKVSTRFAFFLSGFEHESVLILNLIVLDAKFYSVSDGIIFKGGHGAKTSRFWQIINFAPCKNFRKKKNLVQIRP